MAVAIQVDRAMCRVTYQVCLRREAQWLGTELQQLAAFLEDHGRLGHEVLETRVVMPHDGALPYLTVTVTGLLPDDAAWLQRRDRRIQA